MTAAVVWEGPDELRPFLVEIESVKRHPRNPRRGDSVMVAESLSRFGQTRQIVGWDDPETGDRLIVAGNHTLQGAQRLGWTHIAVLFDPGMSEDEATEFLIADNHASDAATYDNPKLVELLQRRYDEGDLGGTGYTADDLDDLIAKANLVGETARHEFEGGYAETANDRDARAAQAQGQGEVKQLLLSYDPETHRRVALELQTLAKEYGTSGVTETVVAAVNQQWEERWRA